MGIKFTNNASSNIIHALTADATSVSITPGTGDLFPSIIEGDYFYATLAGNNGLEIVKVTNRVNDTMTIVRAQDNTTALSFDTGDLFELRIVAADFEDTFSHVETILKDTVDDINSSIANLNTSVDNKISSYLPLSGGPMSGSIVQSGNTLAKRNTSDDRLIIFGGTNASDGSYLRLSGKDEPGYNGKAIIVTSNGTDTAYFEVRPNGTASIGGKNILTSGGGTLTGDLYFAPTGRTFNSGKALNFAADGSGFVGAVFRLIRNDNEIAPGAFSLYVRNANGDWGNNLRGTRDGLFWNNSSILTSAGGTMTGPLICNGFLAKNSVDNNILIIRGGTDNTSAFIGLCGKNHDSNPGVAYLTAANGTNSASFTVSPNGIARVAGKNILTSAGGTVEGRLSFTNIVALSRNVNNSYMQINGGQDWGGGASIELYGKDSGSNGEFAIRANNGTNVVNLAGKVDGSLTWNGKNVLTLVASWRSGNNWYRKYSDGWIEQGGVITVSQATLATVTLHTAFTTTAYTALCGLVTHSGNFGDDVTCNVRSRSTTEFTVYPYDCGESDGSANMTWYACGY